MQRTDASDEARRRLNQTVFGRIYIRDDETTLSGLNQPYGAFQAAQTVQAASKTNPDDKHLRDLFAQSLEANWQRKMESKGDAALAAISAKVACSKSF